MATKRRSKRKTHMGLEITGALILSLLLIIVALNILGRISTLFIDVQPLKKSVLEESLAVNFLVIREEYCVTAQFPGNFEPVAPEGEKVPKGAVVAYVHKSEGTSLQGKSKVPLLAPTAGIVSYQTDGLENICNPETWDEIDLQRLEPLETGLERTKSGNAEDGRQVTAGMMLFRIVNNLSPYYLYLQTDKLGETEITAGKNLDLYLPELSDQPIKGYISDLARENGQTKALLQIPSLNSIINPRRINGRVVVRKYEGFVIPESMLAIKDDLTGVYLFEKGRALWQEVTVLGNASGQVAVKGLTEGQWIITAPGLVKDGQRVFRN